MMSLSPAKAGCESNSFLIPGVACFALTPGYYLSRLRRGGYKYAAPPSLVERDCQRTRIQEGKGRRADFPKENGEIAVWIASVPTGIAPIPT